MRADELAGAEILDRLAVGAEMENRRFTRTEAALVATAVEDPNIVLGIDGDGIGRAPRPRGLCPVGLQLIGIWRVIDAWIAGLGARFRHQSNGGEQSECEFHLCRPHRKSSLSGCWPQFTAPAPIRTRRTSQRFGAP